MAIISSCVKWTIVNITSQAFFSNIDIIITSIRCLFSSAVDFLGADRFIGVLDAFGGPKSKIEGSASLIKVFLTGQARVDCELVFRLMPFAQFAIFTGFKSVPFQSFNPYFSHFYIIRKQKHADAISGIHSAIKCGALNLVVLL